MGRKIEIQKWEELQNKCLQNYGEEKNPVGRFSYNGLKGAENLGNILNEIIANESCLDIGCGLLPLPYYMEVADKVNFCGVDPYDEGVERNFEFVCAVAEELPFGDDSFDNILFATSLDHLYDPTLAITETKRVLRDGGLVIVWTALLGEAGDAHHPLGYSDESIRVLFKEFKFIERAMINVAEFLYIFKK